ncbi:PRC-barrel domain-containing protein [Loktanella fryxellensis]|uniref:PRC-barrel domain-containing protein n=1 Tax=Loktanella fryxellensis TaxID=245187 RepID=A0A1H8DG83_9RHOB|nr:PRC-barrel domain-containing protein [Loktanella fryxellensis]SEN06283.1 PRC-barrel domain-containing protein [Loktanella fryxellensis]
MKKFLATTALALVVANGAFAQTDTTTTDTTEPATTDAPMTDAPAADGMATDAPMTDEPAADGMATDAPMTEAPAADGMATDDAMATDPAMADAAAAPVMAMDGYDTLVNMDVTAEELTGVAVYGTDDNKVGDIGDLVVGTDGTITEVIVDVGGFLGLGAKPVAIAYDSIQLMRQVDGTDMRGYVSMTQEQFEGMPAYEAPMDAAADAADDAAMSDPMTDDAVVTDDAATTDAVEPAPASN